MRRREAGRFGLCEEAKHGVVQPFLYSVAVVYANVRTKPGLCERGPGNFREIAMPFILQRDSAVKAE